MPEFVCGGFPRVPARFQIAARLRSSLLRAAQAVESSVWRHRLPPHPGHIVEEAVAALRTAGVWVTTVERLLGAAAPECRATMAVASALIARRGAGDGVRWRNAGASTDLAHGELLARLPGLFLLGLQAPLLAVAEHYLRVPIAYHGAVLRHSLADGRQVGPRLWHRDSEDFHVLRTVLYLNDVADDGGPFEYLARGARPALPDEGMFSDSRMAAHVPRHHWQRCIGAAGTLVIADSAQVFHHESLQRGRPRSVVMLGHSSRRPHDPALAQAHFPAHRHANALARLVPPRQHPHVFGWRRAQVAGTDASGPPTSIMGDFMPG
jgi:hypothetical protein